ncbi:capping protein-inhibiting regulator of actin dynamics-like [Eptesicus fuscus]|uniref:capping protein-inhibiting regulator of actin dynamics-like n=1 Tax=Eptesicus fuscus TaxID=29078 RepID=UPI002403AF6E|nr:capping protein-inhibiting regulator of actin dynamics-like [Eptesicus fuscus]
MEQLFLLDNGALQLAWDSEDRAAERHPTSSLLFPDWTRPALQLAWDSEDRAAERHPTSSEEQAAERRPKSSEERAAERPPKSSEERAAERPPTSSEERAAERRPTSSEERAAERPPKSSEERAAERRPMSSLLSPDWPRPALQVAWDPEDQAAERRPEDRAAEHRPTWSEERAAERHPTSSEERAAEHRPTSSRSSEERAAEHRPTSSLLSPEWPRPSLQLAWDSEAAERHLWSPLSSDSPPPLCLPLAQSSSHHSDDHQPLLCSPCWQLPSVYLQYRALLAEAQSPSEESPVPPSAGLLPGVPAGAPESPEHTPSPELPGALRPSACAGKGPLDTEAWDPWQPSVCSPPPGPTGWRLHLLGAGCLQCILRAVSSLSRWAADCWATVLDL